MVSNIIIRSGVRAAWVVVGERISVIQLLGFFLIDARVSEEPSSL